MGALVASRFTYRRLFRRAAWLTLPVLALLAVFFPVAAFSARRHDEVNHLFRLLAAGFLIEVVIVAVALAFVVAQLRDSLGSISWLSRALRDNDAPRGVAVGLAAGGGAGLITGHSGRAELTDLGNGAFYANCGTAGRTVDRVDTRAGLPSVYAARLRCSWVELEAGSELRARLWHGARDLPERTLLERMASRERRRAVLAAVGGRRAPGHGHLAVGRRRHGGAPPNASDRGRGHRFRRRLEPRVGGDGADRVPPDARSSASRRSRYPSSRPRSSRSAASGSSSWRAVCAAGNGTRGSLRTCSCSLGIAGNVTKGLDIEEAIVGSGGRDLPARAPRRFHRPREPVVVAAGGGGCGPRHRGCHRRRHDRRRAARTPTSRCREFVEAVVGTARRAAVRPRCRRASTRLVSPALLAVGIGIALSFCWLLFRPAVSPRLSSYRPLSRERARFIVEKYGADSLSYFALRDDKEWFGFRDTLVAYRVHNGIALGVAGPDRARGSTGGVVGRVPGVCRRARLARRGHGCLGGLAARVRRERHARPLHRRRSRRRRAAIQPRRQAEQEPAPVGRPGREGGLPRRVLRPGPARARRRGEVARPR